MTNVEHGSAAAILRLAQIALLFPGNTETRLEVVCTEIPEILLSLARDGLEPDAVTNDVGAVLGTLGNHAVIRTQIASGEVERLYARQARAGDRDDDGLPF